MSLTCHLSLLYLLLLLQNGIESLGLQTSTIDTKRARLTDNSRLLLLVSECFRMLHWVRSGCTIAAPRILVLGLRITFPRCFLLCTGYPCIFLGSRLCSFHVFLNCFLFVFNACRWSSMACVGKDAKYMAHAALWLSWLLCHDPSVLGQLVHRVRSGGVPFDVA